MNEKRQLHRHSLHIPVLLPQGEGVTRNISAGGVYFETTESVPVSGRLRFRLLFNEIGWAESTICCEGTVVRVDEYDENRGIAVRIEEIEFRAVESSTENVNHNSQFKGEEQ
jgi:hypothetical protein